MARMDFWLDEITKAADQELTPILEHWSRLKPWATLPAVQREELAETISKQAADILVYPEQEKKAWRLFDLALGIAPVSARVFLLQGVALYKKAQTTGQSLELLNAKDRFQKALLLLPGFEEARFWLAHCAIVSYEQQNEVSSLEEAKILLFSSQYENSSLFPWVHLQAKWHWLWAQHFEEPSDYRLAISEINRALDIKPDVKLECFGALATMKLIKALGQESLIQDLLRRLKSLSSQNLESRSLQDLALSCHDLCSAYGYRSLLVACRDLWKKAHETSDLFPFELFEKRAAISLILIELEPSALSLREFELMLRNRPQATASETQMAFLWKCHARFCWFEHAEKPVQLKQLLREIEAYRQQGMMEPHYWLLKGSCQLAIAEYFKEIDGVNEAIESFQKGLGIDSDRPGLWLKLARACLSIGDINSDDEASKRAINIFPFAIACGRYDWKFWMDWALALFRVADATGDRGYLSEAIARFEKALELSNRDEKETDAQLLYLYGAALDFLGDLSRDDSYYERAIEKLQAAVLKDPSHSQAPLALAVALTHAGEAMDKRNFLEKANLIFESLAQMDHEDEYLWNEWAVCILSLCRLDLEEDEISSSLLERAIVMLNKAFCLGNQHALYNLCCAYALGKDTDRALDYLEKAFDVGIHPPAEDMAEDDWLDEIRPLARFQEMLEENRKEQEGLADPEDSEDPEGPEEPERGPDRGNLTAS